MFETQLHLARANNFLPSFTESIAPSIVIVERRVLIRECLASCLQERLELPVLAYSHVDDWRRDPAGVLARIIILSGSEGRLDTAQSDLARELFRRRKEVPVIHFSDKASRSHIATSLRCGVKGYVPCDASLDEMAGAIKLVLMGGVFVPPGVVIDDAEDHEPISLRRGAGAMFTMRESEVVEGLMTGKSNKVIAGDLNISENSVKVHIRNVLRKLDVRNRTEAVIKIGKANRMHAFA